MRLTYKATGIAGVFCIGLLMPDATSTCRIEVSFACDYKA
jgi:uncharacterized membrane protein YuzA (DUF378 family)